MFKMTQIAVCYWMEGVNFTEGSACLACGWQPQWKCRVMSWACPPAQWSLQHWDERNGDSCEDSWPSTLIVGSVSKEEEGVPSPSGWPSKDGDHPVCRHQLCSKVSPNLASSPGTPMRVFSHGSPTTGHHSCTSKSSQQFDPVTTQLRLKQFVHRYSFAKLSTPFCLDTL